MVDEECKSWASVFMPYLEHFQASNCLKVQRELKKINDEETLANWFNDFNYSLGTDSSLFQDFSLEIDSLLYEFMKKALSLGKDIVVAEYIFGGSLVGKIVPNEENPSVVVDWFEYSEDLGINNEFFIKIRRSDNDECDMHVTSNDANYNSIKYFVSLTAGRLYGALNLAIEDNKIIDDSIDYVNDGYLLLKKM